MNKTHLLILVFIFSIILAIPHMASALSSVPSGVAGGSSLFQSGFSSGGGVNIRNLAPYVNGILYIINFMLVPLLFALAFVTFIWGIFKYFFYGADNEEEIKKGKSFVMWGIIGFVIIFSVWGIVAVVGNTFQLNAGGSAPVYPTL